MKKIVPFRYNIGINEFEYKYIKELPNKIIYEVEHCLILDKNIEELEVVSCFGTITLKCSRLENDYEYKNRLEKEKNIQKLNQLNMHNLYDLTKKELEHIIALREAKNDQNKS